VLVLMRGIIFVNAGRRSLGFNLSRGPRFGVQRWNLKPFEVAPLAETYWTSSRNASIYAPVYLVTSVKPPARRLRCTRRLACFLTD
jgi:hypothetical protein